MNISQFILENELDENSLVLYLEKTLNIKLLCYRQFEKKPLTFPYNLVRRSKGFKTTIELYLGNERIDNIETAVSLSKHFNTNVLIDPLDELFEWLLITPNGELYNVNEKFSTDETDEDDFIDINFDSK